MDWVLLVPAGVEVTIVRESEAVEEPTLLTAEQIVALTDLAASMVKAGLPVDVGELIRRASAREVTRQTIEEADYVTVEIDRPPQPPQLHVWACVCGRTYRDELALRGHQRACGEHQRGSEIPPEFRLDS